MNFIGIESQLICLVVMAVLYHYTDKPAGRVKWLYLLNGFAAVLGIFDANIVVVSVAVLDFIFALILLLSSFLKKDGDGRGNIAGFAILVAGGTGFAFLPYGIILVTYCIMLSLCIGLIDEKHKKIRTDNLTKLNNRYGMDDAIYEQIMEYKKDKNDSFYLIVCDLDNFKHINDTWGHLKGDEALTCVSKALSTVAEEYEAEVFRIGGDEFVVVVDTSDEALVNEMCDKIKCELDEIDLNVDFAIRMSMGTALYDGVSEISELLNKADKQLYQAKAKNKR